MSEENRLPLPGEAGHRWRSDHRGEWEMVMTPWGYNVPATLDDARRQALSLDGRPGTTWWIWRMPTSFEAYDITGVPDPERIAPARWPEGAELAESFTVPGKVDGRRHSKRRHGGAEAPRQDG